MTYTEETEFVGSLELNNIFQKLAAVDNNVRFSILEILRDYQKNADSLNDYPYSREINIILKNKYDIVISPQMLGQHMKQLYDAGLIEIIQIKKEIPNKIGPRQVNVYALKVDAFEDFFLEITFLSDELIAFFELFKENQKDFDGKHCILTIFNGSDKGKTFKLNKEDIIHIGRKSSKKLHNSQKNIILNSEYYSVSKVDKPHLKIFYEDNNWCILDENSSNGTYISNRKIKNRVKTKLKNNTFLKLSRGGGSAIIFCSY